jgi:hypothetical protein
MGEVVGGRGRAWWPAIGEGLWPWAESEPRMADGEGPSRARLAEDGGGEGLDRRR